MDVLSASYGDNKIAWYQNGGGSPPTWTPYTITSNANGPLAVFAAKLDDDRWTDVLSASWNDGKVIWYKNGGGSQPTWTNFTIAASIGYATSVYAVDGRTTAQPAQSKSRTSPV